MKAALAVVWPLLGAIAFAQPPVPPEAVAQFEQVIGNRVEAVTILGGDHGAAVKAAASGTYVDWQLDTWTVVPSLELQYDWRWRRVELAFSSRYNFFHTESFGGSSPVVSVDGNSHLWENKLEADVPLGWKVFGRELHTGGFFARTELSGGAADGLNASHVYTVNGRFVLDLIGAVWKVRWLGLGASYFFADHFDGWSAGVDMRFQF